MSDYGYLIQKDNYGKSNNVDKYKKIIGDMQSESKTSSQSTSQPTTQNQSESKYKSVNMSDFVKSKFGESKEIRVTDNNNFTAEDMQRRMALQQQKDATKQEVQNAYAIKQQEEKAEQERWDKLSFGEKIVDPFKTMGANIKYGDLGIEENQAWSEYRSKQDAESLAKAQQATKAREEYEASNDRIGKGNALTKDFAQYMPQLGGQLKSGLGGAAAGAGAGTAGGAGVALVAGQLGPQVAIPEEIATVPAGALTGAIWGGKGGYVAGTAKYSYDLMAGSAYKNLLDMGVPNDVALELSGDEAFISSLLEGAGSVVDLISLGFGKLASKGATTATKKVALNRLAAAGKAYGLNLITEPLEEMAQEKVSIETEKRAADISGIERQSTEAQDTERIKQSGLSGLKISAISGLGNIGGNVISNKVSDKIEQNQMNKEIEDMRTMYKTQQAMDTYKKLSPYSKYQVAETNNQISTKDIKQHLGLPEGGKIYVDENGVAIDSKNYIAPRENNEQNSKYSAVNAKQVLVEPAKQLKGLGNLLPQKNNATEQAINDLQQPMQQVNQVEGKTAQNGNMTQIVKNNAKLEKDVQELPKKLNIATEFVEIDDVSIEGYEKDGKIYINRNAEKPYNRIFKHELTHYLEQNGVSYDNLSKEIMNSNAFANFLEDNGLSLEEYKQNIVKTYADKGINLTEQDASREVISKFVEEKMFNDEKSIRRLAEQNPSLIQKVKNWIDDMLVKFRGTAEEKELLRMQKIYKEALSGVNNTSDGKISMSIETIPNTNKKYVKATRQVISGDNPLMWENQVENYINEKIRNNEDVNVLAEDGTLLTITKDTAGKAKFRNDVIDKNGNKRKLNNKEFSAKLRAETHIDELAQVSKLSKGLVADTKEHDFAKDGFTYRTAYFEDADGKYYKITMSVGKNGDINTIYNIGRMNKAQKNRSNPNNELKGSSGNTTSNRIASNNSIPVNDKTVNTKYSLESKNDTGGDKTTASRMLSRYAQTLQKKHKDIPEHVNLIQKEIDNGNFTHEVIKDKRSLNYAEKYIKENGFEDAVNHWDELIKRGKPVDKDELALGQMIYNIAADNKDTKLFMKMASDLVQEYTEIGRNLQSATLLRKMTPDGRLYSLERSVQKINQDLMQKFDDFENIQIPEELADKLLNSKNQTEMDTAVEEIQLYIAEQIPATWQEKLNSWRYLSMLGNPRTHIRNIVGNMVFIPAVEVKNAIAQVGEKFIPQDQRTKAMLGKKDAELLEYAENDFDRNKETIRGENKYDIRAGIQEKRTIYSTKALEAARKGNFDLLEAEDTIFLKYRYKKAFAQALKARGITLEQLREATPQITKKVNEIRSYAINEAQKATYRDASVVASMISKGKRKLLNAANQSTGAAKLGYNLAYLGVEGVVPFTKTPINIVKRGLEYSPAGLLNGVKDAVFNVKNGKVTASQAIDKIAAGTTGTGIMALGYLLASLGLVNGGEEEKDKEQALKELKGYQDYSLNVFGKSYTIDWTAPSSIPLFIGVELYNSITSSDESAYLKALANIAEPVVEMSMLQGLNSTLTIMGEDNAIGNVIGKTLMNYLGQYNPTLLGQLARSIDKKRRTTYVDKNIPIPASVQRFIQQQVAKIPGASMLLPTYKDQFGQEQITDNIIERVVQNFLSPGYLKDIKEGTVGKGLTELYEKTGETSIIPSYASKTLTLDGEKINLTAKEYDTYAKTRGDVSLKGLEGLLGDKNYKKLSDEQKVKVIEGIYDYANDVAKTKVLKGFELEGNNKKAQNLNEKGLDFYKFVMIKKTADTDGNGYTSSDELDKAISKYGATRWKGLIKKKEK